MKAKKQKPSHSEIILWMLQNDQLITPSNVYNVTKKHCWTGCMKLSTRIGELKKQGHNIKGFPVVSKRGNYYYYELVNNSVNNFPNKKVKGNKK